MQRAKKSNIGNDINTLLMPMVCFGCNARLYRGEYVLCTFCRDQIPLTDHNYLVENAVDRIFYGRYPIIKAASLMFYSDKGIVKNMIHYLKYRRQEVVGEFLGAWFGSKITGQKGVSEVERVIPVPLHKKKLRRRGYNQVSLFAKEIAKSLYAEVDEKSLIKTANTRTQTYKNRLFRSLHQEELYRVCNPEELVGATIMIADDVITTGATLEACCRAFDRIPGIKIYLATMAFVP